MQNLKKKKVLVKAPLIQQEKKIPFFNLGPKNDWRKI